MRIDKNYKGLIDEGWRYKIDGNIETTESLVIDLDKGLYVTGDIEAGEFIEVSESIEATGNITAGEAIEAGWFIEATGNITAGESIEATGNITAGGAIEAGWSITASGAIEAGEFITARGAIEAGEFIEAGWHITAGGAIEAGESIQAGGSSGIVAGLHIACKTTLSFGLRLFAGTCSWRRISDEDKTITCGRLVKGTIEYGILKELELPEEDDKMKDVMELLRNNGYRIVKD